MRPAARPCAWCTTGKDAFAERDLDAALERAVKLRREVLRLDETTNAYRVLHGDSDGLGGLVVDRYAERACSLEVSTLARLAEAEPLAAPAAPPVRAQNAMWCRWMRELPAWRESGRRKRRNHRPPSGW